MYAEKMSTVGISELLQLPVNERLRLVEALWDSIVDAPEPMPLTESERKELDRRWAEYVKDPTAGSPWSEVRARILAR